MEGTEMPRPNKTGLTPQLLEALKRQGYNQTQVAEMFGTTRQHVSWVKRQAGTFTQTPREEANGLYPWKVGKKFNGSQSDRKLRDHAEYMLTQGKDMSREKLARLRTFYRTLKEDNVVVEHDPDIPPTKGNPQGGFAFRPREERDGDLIIRVNDLAEMTPEAYEIWKFPRNFRTYRTSDWRKGRSRGGFALTLYAEHFCRTGYCYPPRCAESGNVARLGSLR